jgi:hypothetical protein
MQPTTAQYDILRAAAAFSAVERYSGTMPKRQALHYDKKQLAALEDAGFLERVKLSFPCGKDIEGWRLTPPGRLILTESAGEDALEPEHLRILSDVYHYSRLSQNRGMMPKELAKSFDADDVRDLFLHGYLLRINLKGSVKAKGWVVSNKGLAALRRASGPAVIATPACAARN